MPSDSDSAIIFVGLLEVLVKVFFSGAKRVGKVAKIKMLVFGDLVDKALLLVCVREDM